MQEGFSLVLLLPAKDDFFVRKRRSGQNEAICHILIFCYNEMHTPVTYIGDWIRIDGTGKRPFLPVLGWSVRVSSVTYLLR